MIIKSSNQVSYLYIIIVIVTYSSIASILFEHVCAKSPKNYKEMEVLDDLPLQSTFEDYLDKLEKIIEFVKKHIRYVDMNLAFGLFLVNVNLKTVLEIRGIKMPKIKSSRVEQILRNYHEINIYFQDMLSKHSGNTEAESSAYFITDLFSKSAENWESHLRKFKIDLLKKTHFYSKKELTERFSKWPKYVEKVYDFDHYSPTPLLSDDCISSLSQVPVNPTMKWTRCDVSSLCVDLVRNGTDYGYAITHRLLYLIMTRFSRGCTIRSGAEDKKQIDNFCLRAYNELEYHSYHNFEMPDLSLEIIALCTLEGHEQFLRRAWIEDLLEYQKEVGCVASNKEGKEQRTNLELYDIEKPDWKIVEADQDILGGSCNTHTTGVAAAVLSAGIRYIMEKFTK